MPVPSSIYSLPAEARKALDGWLRDPAVTQTEAVRRVNALLEDLDLGERRVSHMAVNRYDLRLRASGERVLQWRALVEAWTAKFGSVPAGPLGLIVIEILRTLAFDIAPRLQNREFDDESLTAVVDAAAKISRMVEILEHSSEIVARREHEIKRQAAEDLDAKADGETKGVAALDPEKLREIVREVYGV